ncbi:hypothetical protein Barb6_01790 [Bacteroidales bacterium Barb6]|nr:hypothetical protein Barb6_01790 [Bacteroidales bacterium Barb6]
MHHVKAVFFDARAGGCAPFGADGNAQIGKHDCIQAGCRKRFVGDACFFCDNLRRLGSPVGVGVHKIGIEVGSGWIGAEGGVRPFDVPFGFCGFNLHFGSRA